MINIFKTAADFFKSHPTLTKTIAGAAIGGFLGCIADAPVVDSLADNFKISIGPSSSPAPASNSSMFSDDWYTLQNLREERKHEERMAELNARNRSEEKHG